MLNLALGDIDELGGASAIRSHSDAKGHVLYGPYEELQPGKYRVTFTLAPAEAFDPNAVVAVVDVVTDFGKTDIAFDYVLGSELTTETDICLEFDVERDCTVEYRVHANGRGAVRVQDNPTVEKRHDGAPLASRIPQVDGAFSADDRGGLKLLYLTGVPIEVRDGKLSFPLSELNWVMTRMLLMEGDRKKIARILAEAIAFNGDDENALYRAFIGSEQPITSPPQPVPFSSSLCHQTHFGLDQYRYWARALKQNPRFLRKQWEFIYIAQVLYERGLLQPGKRGLAFGAGEEQLPALFASFGVQIVATDQTPEMAAGGGWIETGQLTHDVSALNSAGICTDRMFSELVSFKPVDMNVIPAELDGQFDFCWSACAFEHLGSLRNGLSFVENSLRTLKPGGVAVHTTEFNLSSNKDTIESPNLSVFRRRDIEELHQRLVTLGYDMSPIDWNLGEGFAETVVDLPPFGRGEPHLRLRVNDYDMTSIGLIVTAPISGAASAKQTKAEHRRWWRKS